MKKRIVHILAMITVVALTLSLCVIGFASAGIKHGDMDANGVVDEYDAIYLLQHVLMPDEFPLEPEEEEVPEVTPVPPVDYTVYADKISEYRQELTMGIDAFEEKYDGGTDYSSVNTLMIRFAYDGEGSLYYTISDIDGNGVSELIFSDSHSIIDIYTVHNGALVKLFANCAFGERTKLHVLSTGELLVEGSDGAASGSCELYRIDTAAGKLSDPIAAYYYDDYGPNGYMDGYTYVTVNEYFSMLNSWESNAIFHTLKWSLVAKSNQKRSALFGELDYSKAWHAEYWNDGYMLNLYFVFDENGVCYFAVGEWEIFYRQFGLYTEVNSNTLSVKTISGGTVYESLYRFDSDDNSLTVISDTGLIGSNGESYILKEASDIDAETVKTWATTVGDLG